MNHGHFTLYGWRLSWYTSKVRAYLQYKSIPYEEKKPSLFTYKRTIARHAGDAAVPVVVTPEGHWLQDSTHIIERLEQRFPHAPVYPATPIQRVFSDLVEIWADEFWHPTAEHYRFSFPENFPAWRDELRSLLPGFPRFLQHGLVNHFYQYMLSVTREVGVVPDSLALVEQWSEAQLDALERHFGSMPFLLGQRATLGDFALMGPIFGHLAFDPRSIRVLIAPRPQLAAWLQRMSTAAPCEAALLAEDEVPYTLQPMLFSLFDELLPYLAQCAEALKAMAPRSAADPRYPRMGPQVEIPFGGGTIQRVTIPYVLWMVQNLRDRVACLPERDAARVRGWLQAHGGESLLTLAFPRLRRIGLHVAPEVGGAGC